MKPDWTSEDAVIDKLLRAHMGRLASHGSACPGFDPDLANAYVEQVLSAAERGRYEVHLAECSDCRTAIVALAQVADVPAYGANPDLAPAGLAEAETRPGWREAVAAFLGILNRPQWMAAAGLALFALVVFPLLVLRMNALKDERAEMADARQAAPALASTSGSGSEGRASAATQSGEVLASNTQLGARAAGVERTVRAGDAAAANEDRKTAASGGTPGAAADKPEQPSERAAAAEVTAGAPPARARDDEAAAPKDARSESTAKESTAEANRPLAERKREAREASADPSLPKIPPTNTLRLPDEKGTSEVSVVRGISVRDDIHPKEKSGAIKSQDAPPPDSSADPPSPRRVAAQPSGRALVGGRASEEAARGPAPATTAGKPEKSERRIEGKRFRLVNGVWTDRAYRPAGAMAAVTLIKDSDVYNQLIAKESGLKPYLSHFGPDERAVIVYKKIAYKLLPKETRK